ncbi:polymorphic toxin-type HINT domain-containing protein [Ruminococcus sp.]|uniref:polymorphic toxin-type HINT domain-containing protein n=1 Tax=Ruminococcus sp. TaxID=41978 RepID=UPI00399228E8
MYSLSKVLSSKFNASCFAAGTMIETADGDRPIEEIQIGDLVLSANPETGEIAYKPVVNTYVHVTDTVLYLTIDEEIIETTEIFN